MDCKTSANHLLAILLSLSTTGCSLSGGGKVKQLEAESERLLSDYRYERERADRLEVLNNSLTERIGQLEQRLGYRHDSNSDRLATPRPVDNLQRQPTLSDRSPWQPTLRR